MSLIGTTAVTQGPQGTVSSVVMEDEEGSCWTVLIQALPPNLASKVFQLLLSKTHFQNWEVVQLTCPYSLNPITDSAGQSRNGRRGNVLHHVPSSQLSNPIIHRFSPSHITRIHPSYAPKAHKLSEKQVSGNEELESNVLSCVPQKTVRNMTTNDNPGTLP